MSNFYHHTAEQQHKKILEAEYQPRDVDGCPTDDDGAHSCNFWEEKS